MAGSKKFFVLVMVTAFAVLGIAGGASANPAVKVSVGFDFACALKPNGRVICWGNRSSGRGNIPPGKYKAIDAGGHHICAIRTDSTVVCWGPAIGTETAAPGGKFKWISVSYRLSCGLKLNGKAKCWGNDNRGQVSGPTGTKLKSISTGYEFTCGTKPNDQAKCWAFYAESLYSFSDFKFKYKQVSGGAYHACGLKLSGKIVCFGRNDFGETVPPKKGKFRNVAAGYYTTCGLLRNSKPKCWGSNADNIVSNTPKSKFLSISSDPWAKQICGVRKNRKKVFCWGDNSSGQLTIPPALR